MNHVISTHFALFFCIFAASAIVHGEELPNFARETGIHAGLAIHLGASDGKAELQLAEGGRMLVHGLAFEQKQLDTAREVIQKAGRYGLASIHLAQPNARLPYADDIANLIVADLDRLGEHASQMEEIERVLAPGGVAFLRRDGSWGKHTEAVPDDVDTWPQWDHGADGNPFSTDERIAPTTSLRWLAGATAVDGAGSKVGLRINDGTVYYTGINYGISRRFRRNEKNDIFARDAFNGILQWKRDIEGVPGGGDTPPRFALTAGDGVVYAYPEARGPLHAIDTDTGKTAATFDQGPQAPPIDDWHKWNDPVRKIHFIVRVFDDKLLQTYQDVIYVSDAKSGKLLWKESVGEDSTVGWAVVGDGRIYAAVSDRPLVKNRASPVTPTDRILALDTANGKKLWQYDELGGYAAFRMMYYRDSVIVPTFPIKDFKPNFGRDPLVVRLNAADGKPVWKVTPKAEARGHYSVVLGRGDEIIIGQQGGFGIDFETGELTQKYGWGQIDNSCADLKCVPGYTMYGLTFLDDKGDRITRGQTRTICDVGLFPAYGLLYGSPLGCLCSEYINGYPALSAEPLWEPAPESDRLTRGPAFGKVGRPATDRNPDEWPLHMADARRSNWSPKSVADELKVAFKAEIAHRPDGILGEDWRENEKIVGPLSAPTVAAGKVFLAECDAHQLHALNANIGKVAWSFTAAARIDSPPTILHAGDDALCLFGARDGYVYCLRASDGELVWKYLVAPNEKFIGVQSQMESAWPVYGSVMIDGDAILVAAGRQSAIDGGIRLVKLRPHDGHLLWQTKIWNDPDRKIDKEIDRAEWAAARNQRVNELLVHSGQHAALWITPLKDTYDDGELVDIDTGVYSARALRHSLQSKEELLEIVGATWLRSASSNGLLSRRTDGVGRHDVEGVSYAQLTAEKICLTGHEGDSPSKYLYALRASSEGTKELRGGLIRVRVNSDGTLPAKPEIDARAPRQGFQDAMVVAGNRIYIAYAHPHSEEAQLLAYSAEDGEPIKEIPLPARIVRDGLAVAYGRLYATGADGAIYCLGK